MHASLEFDYAILAYILHFFALCRGPKWGAWHNTPTLNTSLDMHVLISDANLPLFGEIRRFFDQMGYFCESFRTDEKNIGVLGGVVGQL